MNLSDSVLKVLKSKSRNIFTEFWKDDVKSVILEMGHDIARVGRNGKKSFKNLKRDGIKLTASEMFDSARDGLLIFKVIPKRIKVGLVQFKENFLSELEALPTQKDKTIFSLKVLGSLTSFTMGAIYTVKKGKNDFSLSGLRRHNAFTQFIVAELVFKICSLFIQRFLIELEKEVSDEDDLKKVKYFKNLLVDSPEDAESMSENTEPGDPATELVEKLKRFIMTGK